MNIKSTIIRVAVQLIAANTDIIREETPSTQFINSLFGIESEQERFARSMESAVDKTVATAKRIDVNRKFKKITQNV